MKPWSFYPSLASSKLWKVFSPKTGAVILSALFCVLPLHFVFFFIIWSFVCGLPHHCRSGQLCITMDSRQKTFECQKLFGNSSKTILAFVSKLFWTVKKQFGPWPTDNAEFSLLNIGNYLEHVSDQMISVPPWYWDIGPIFLIERVTIPDRFECKIPFHA